MLKISITLTASLILLALMLPSTRATAAPASLDACDVIWNTPSADARGSMPIGNGEVGLSAWVEPDGDLQFYISRTDSYSEVSRLLKVGLVRVRLSPNPFKSGAPFVQHLRIRDGVIEIAGGVPGSHVDLNLFVDADHPVVHCFGHSDAPMGITVTVESWREKTKTLAGDDLGGAWTMNGAPYPLVESADQFSSPSAHSVLWYHRNETTCVPATLTLQGLDATPGVFNDPLLHRTFGGLAAGPNLIAKDPRTLVSAAPSKAFAVRIACPCAQTKTPEDWTRRADAALAASADPNVALLATRHWWHQYWSNAWIGVSGDAAPGVPGGAFPLRVGYDSDHENKFPGTIGRTDIYNRALSLDEIKQLASADRTAPAPIVRDLISETDGTPGETPASKIALREGVTLAAWINPKTLTDGRIFDKLTAGQDDGFLLDTHPGDTIRFIYGSKEITAPTGLLKAGTWQFVAATADQSTGAAVVTLDGKVIASVQGRPYTTVTQAYTWQRYMQACGGRGTLPIKYNGGQFTVGYGGAMNLADTRHWGDPHWWQNIRHVYYPMLAEGDFAMMQPMFRMYENAVPVGKARAKFADHVNGCFFPETMTIWGTYANSDYGWSQAGPHNTGVEASPWHGKTRNQGPELVTMMLDYWDYTRDETFLKGRLVPFAASVLTYFDERFKRDAAGKLVIEPTQSIETFWHGVSDDTPTVAGLANICPRLAALPLSATTPEQRALFARMAAACPDVPTEIRQTARGPINVIAPARKYDPQRNNCENPETYAIWPERLYGIGKPGLQMARDTYALRMNNLPVGWGYDGNDAATLGLSGEASSILLQKCANSNPEFRWPATWGPNFDWLPDQNHGGNLLETTQLMLMQCEGRKILLFPAWPKTWDVDFKLHASGNTTIEATLKHGQVTRLIVTPEARRRDVVFCAFEP